MSDAPKPVPPSAVPISVSMDEFVALGTEMAALARAGVPLESGLAELGRDMPGGLGQLASAIAARTSGGEPLATVLADPAYRLPSVCRAVVEAGLRGGRLPAALETLATTVRRLAEARRTVAYAVIYPVLVFVLAWCFVALFTMMVAPKLLVAFEGLGTRGTGVLRSLAWLGQGAIWWGPIGAVATLGLACAWWYFSAQVSVVDAGGRTPLLGWIPGLGRMVRSSRAAAFAEILAMLLEHGVPLGEAIRLAAEASGDSRLSPAARQWAAAVERGEPMAAQRQPHTLLPLLAWILGGIRQQELAVPALRHAAETYHRQAQRQADFVRIFMPVVFTLGLSGLVSVMYAVMLFLPYSQMLRVLAGP